MASIPYPFTSKMMYGTSFGGTQVYGWTLTEEYISYSVMFTKEDFTYRVPLEHWQEAKSNPEILSMLIDTLEKALLNYKKTSSAMRLGNTLGVPMKYFPEPKESPKVINKVVLLIPVS